MAAPSADGRHAARVLSIKYGAVLIYAHLSAAIAVAIVIRVFRDSSAAAAHELQAVTHLWVLPLLVVVAAAIGAASGMRYTAPVFRWFAYGTAPDAAQQRAAIRITNRQAVVQFLLWIACGVGLWLFNIRLDKGMLAVLAATVVIGGAMAASMGWLLAQRVVRPVIAAALVSSSGEIATLGVRARVGAAWALFTAVPAAGIVLLVLAKMYGGLATSAISIEAPVLVLAVILFVFSCRAMLLVAGTVADPIRDVVLAMKEVGRGDTDVRVAVYEPSEIGDLQSGFNRMVEGLAEREQLRDLFGRYVGTDVAQHALTQKPSLSGEVCDVAVLFIDLVASTELAVRYGPHRTAEILNAFFQRAIAAVEAQQGSVNKFEGDAVLAVFGAPLRLADPVSAALVSARQLSAQIRAISEIGFGIGVSYGSVFAGTVGAEHRYEYTVIGDPVNEAARLADEAKGRNGRVLCSARALDIAADDERNRWRRSGSTLLRGRSTVTYVAEPI
jgi:class 3 adenylate cyclase